MGCHSRLLHFFKKKNRVNKFSLFKFKFVSEQERGSRFDEEETPRLTRVMANATHVIHDNSCALPGLQPPQDLCDHARQCIDFPVAKHALGDMERLLVLKADVRTTSRHAVLNLTPLVHEC